MKKIKALAGIAVVCMAACLSFSFDSLAKKEVPIDTTIEDSRESGTDLYEATKFHNVLDLDISISDGTSASTIHDEAYSTSVTLSPGTTITVNCDTTMYGTFIVWDSVVPTWQMQINGNTYTYGTNGFIHEYIELPEPTTSFTIIVGDSSSLGLVNGSVYGQRIADIYAFGSGELPSWVQTWEPVATQADILVVSSHADDEQIFFGGIFPKYSDAGLTVQVAFFENHWSYDSASRIREHEKLAGLWLGGLRNYPITSDFSDAYSETVDGALNTISWDSAVSYAVGVIRRTHPLVVATHAANGEYGHGQHMLTSAAVTEAVTKAADATYDTASFNSFGIWNTPKYYVHFYDQNTVHLDYRTPLDSFGGKTAIEVARQAYKCHESQQWCWFVIDDYGETSNADFGLYYSTVGLDAGANDFMENLPAESRAQIREDAAKEKGITYIYTADDMFKMAADPYGSFRLMNDIDMTGVEWTPVTFYGIFNGNGNAILNLTVTTTGSSTRLTYDGNMITYDTSFAGLFDVLDGATISNLTLLGVNIDINTDTDCFIGPVAGYIENTTLDNCIIEGSASLFVNASMFGVGGIVGYGGNSTITNTTTDMLLINVDLDAQNRDEQYMGGGYGAGYINFDNCTIKLEGYDSDHGYVHDGGLVGMYVVYPSGTSFSGYVTNTRTEGTIHFFEDNTNRRAYCSEFWGEVMNWVFEISGNSSDFVRDETFDYSVNLLPHYCENPEYTESVVEADCSGYTYTLYTCNTCNSYSYKGNYQVPTHSLGETEIIEEATYEETGVSRQLCSVCGKYIYEITPVLEPVINDSVSDNSSVSDDSVSANGTEKSGITPLLFAIPGVLIAGGAGYAVYNSKPMRRRRRRRKKRKNKRNARRNTPDRRPSDRRQSDRSLSDQRPSNHRPADRRKSSYNGPKKKSQSQSVGKRPSDTRRPRNK